MGTTLLCLASYEKGADFLREARRQGARVLLLTSDTLVDIDWPRESIDGFYHMPDLYRRDEVVRGVSYLARTESIDRIIALDEFDLEMAATLREQLRVPGLGESAARAFRDKLVMRERAHAAGVPVPEFTSVINYDRLRAYLESVAPPWVLKPRTQASAIGIRKLDVAEQVWRALDELGDEQSGFLIERYVPGAVFHVDGIVAGGEPVFEEVHRYASPPLDVMHGGGLFCTRTFRRNTAIEGQLESANRAVVRALGLEQGAVHTEFIRDHEGSIYFLETAARVGGAHIVETVEAATGVNLWHEWAKLEVAAIEGRPYKPPHPRQDYAGVLISLARQEWPDTSDYADTEIVWRLKKRHHVGLIVASPDSDRLDELLHGYMSRFMNDFHAALPAPSQPTA